jgi:hypothetical protein
MAETTATISTRLEAERTAATVLSNYEMSGCRPFTGTNGADRAGPILHHARALLLLLSGAFDDAESLTGGDPDKADDSGTANIRDSLKAEALRGIEDLVSLAIFFTEAA